MTVLVLPGGTDVAEMALFSTDQLPEEFPDQEVISNLERLGVLLRFFTGADGGYLLHAYVSQSIPENVLSFCDRGTAITAKVTFESGKLAFGGVESVSRSFKPNPAIRSDAIISPGAYSVVAYRTEFPDEVVKRVRSQALSSADRRFLAMPSLVFPVCMIAIVVLGVLHYFVHAVAILAALAGWWNWFKKRPAYRLLRDKDEEVQLQFPSIVAALTPFPSGDGLAPQSNAISHLDT